jgi:2',3'-cyclic-nucleotide 2'-phosphodiesterase (5'-nucleotidase family)
MGTLIARARLLAVALALVLLAQAAWAQSAKITFLHVNDVYEIVPVRGWGGFAPLMTVLKQERQQSPNSVTTLGGDLISPSLMSGMTKGQQMVDLFNAVGLDLAIFGNHEFDFGDEVLKQRMAESKFTWLATNVLGADKKPFGGALATLQKEIAGFKFGFFGLTTPESESLSSPGKEISFAPTIETAAEAVKTLKQQGAEVIVAITHLTIAEDRELVRRVKGIDLVLGGHDHDPITFYEGGTLIHKAGYDAHFLAAIDLDVSRAPQQSGPPKITVVPSWRMHAVYNVAPDPAVAETVKRYTDKLDAELGVKIGTSSTALDSRLETVRTQEATIGNLIADAIRAAMGADVAITNGGGIRGNRTYDAGYQLTRRDVFTELPFGNTTVLIELKGEDLLAALENGVSRVEEKQGRFPQISGMSFAFDPTKPAGSRVSDVKVAGQPLDPARVYKIATNDYMAGGGDSYEALKKGKSLIDPSAAKLMATQVMDYIAAKGTVAPAIEGRIVRR